MVRLAPFRLSEPTSWQVPLVVSAPHAGVEMPEGFSLPSGAAGQRIIGMSDMRIDEVARPAAQAWGFPILSSRYLRAFIDLNRSVTELDPELIDGLAPQYLRVAKGSRVAAGLGLIPRLADPVTPIYPGRLSVRAIQSRVERAYKPYHDCLQGLIEQCLDRFGTCILLDLHSMPPLQSAVARRSLSLTPGQPSKAQQQFPQSLVNLVLGDQFGETLPIDAANSTLAYWQDLGFTIAHNRPYAGGFITESYGRQVPTLQLEVCRSLYPGTHRPASAGLLERAFQAFIPKLLEVIPAQRLAAE